MTTPRKEPLSDDVAAHLRKLLSDVIAAERERCAKVAEEVEFSEGVGYWTAGVRWAARNIAAALRKEDA